MFFVRDGIKFPDMVHALKPNPKNHIQEGWRIADFFSHIPESMHMVSLRTPHQQPQQTVPEELPEVRHLMQRRSTCSQSRRVSPCTCVPDHGEHAAALGTFCLLCSVSYLAPDILVITASSARYAYEEQD